MSGRYQAYPEYKDSGVEWLGEVPEGWELIPLKHLCTFNGGGTPSKENLNYWSGGNIPWVSPKDMKTFWLTDTQDKLTKLAVEESSTNYVECGALYDSSSFGDITKNDTYRNQ